MDIGEDAFLSEPFAFELCESEFEAAATPALLLGSGPCFVLPRDLDASSTCLTGVDVAG